MAPSGPRSMTAPTSPTPVTEHPPARGPHPGYVSIARQYTFEQKIRRMQKENGCDPSREDNYRLLGIQLIDNVREALQLPVRTFDTACTYYHKFRLCFRDAEYNYQDAALAALFVACKVEDTIKKSKEILCAAYNLKNADHPTTQDDKVFEQPSKIVIGLERLILETIGFDFRVRYPQKLLTKVVRKEVSAGQAREFISVAYPMCIDMYKTFSPIKQSTFAMVMGVVELTARLLDKDISFSQNIRADRYHTTRGCVVETMLDLLDLYTHHPKSTKIGARFDLAKFIDIKIQINQEVDGDRGLARHPDWCDRCAADDRDAPNPVTPGSAISPPGTSESMPGSNSIKRNAKGQQGTTRFLFDADEARREQEAVGEYYKEEYEEYEMEVDEEMPEQQRNHSNNNNNNNNNNHGHGHGPGGQGHGGGSRRDRGRNHHDQSWGPYPNRNRHNDRHKGGRKGSYYQ